MIRVDARNADVNRLVECIKMEGADVILADRVRAHDTRAVSSSWALLNGASLKEIQQAAFWSNPNSFIYKLLSQGRFGW